MLPPRRREQESMPPCLTQASALLSSPFAAGTWSSVLLGGHPGVSIQLTLPDLANKYWKPMKYLGAHLN